MRYGSKVDYSKIHNLENNKRKFETWITKEIKDIKKYLNISKASYNI